MTRQLTIPGTQAQAVALSAAWAESVRQALARVLEPHAPATQRAYRTAWQRWAAHCAALEHEPLPIRALELVAYLEALSRSHAPNTVRLHLAALSSLDVAARTTPADPSPQSLRSAQVVRRWLRAWSREHPRAARKAAPALTVAQLSRVLAVAQERPPGSSRAGHLERYARDRCLILWGVLGAFRVSELVALELEHVTVSDRGISLRVARAKTDQEGRGELVGLMPQGNPALCPVEAWRGWMAVRGDAPGPMFLGIDRAGDFGGQMSERQAMRRVAELAARADVPLVSSHSMRATFATLAAAHGRNLAAIAKQGRWRSLDQVRQYVRQGELFVDNPSAGLLHE